jgi:hypothetical protein
MYNEGCDAIVRNCTFEDNYGGTGAGMANYDGARPTVEGCIFEDNSGGIGGGMYNYQSAPDVMRCVFSANQASGSGMYNYGGKGNPLVVNCVFSQNLGIDVYNTAGGQDFNDAPVFTNCTFNKTTSQAVMQNTNGAPTVTNCILWTGNYGDGVYVYGKTDASFRCCDVNGSGGSASWDTSIGRDGGGNIEEKPLFRMAVNGTVDADGDDNVWMTADDGLELELDEDYLNPCVDAADDDAAPERDITGAKRRDISWIEGSVADMGAYEGIPWAESPWSPWSPEDPLPGDMLSIVAVVFIDESYGGCSGCVTYYSDEDTYLEHLDDYCTLIGSGENVRSGCLVPPNPGLNDPTPPYVPGIAAVLPEGHDPPVGISVETCSRPPSRYELMADFDRIRDGLDPPVIILSVDNSTSLVTGHIDPGYSQFKDALREAYPYARFVERDDCESATGCFDDQAWVDELRSQIHAIVGP